MKKNFMTIAMAVLAALVLVATPVEAQTRQQKKDAKKEAKRLAKEGYLTMALPLQRQLEDFYVRMSERDEEGMPAYLMADNMAIGNSYTAAQMEAVNVAKTRLAGQIESAVLSQAKVELANSTLSSEDAASITKALEKSTQMVAQRLSRVLVAQEYYRILNNKNYEVHVVLLYSTKAVREMVLQDARKMLQDNLKEFKPEYEKVLNQAVNEGVK